MTKRFLSFFVKLYKRVKLCFRKRYGVMRFIIGKGDLLVVDEIASRQKGFCVVKHSEGVVGEQVIGYAVSPGVAADRLWVRSLD